MRGQRREEGVVEALVFGCERSVFAIGLRRSGRGSAMLHDSENNVKRRYGDIARIILLAIRPCISIVKRETGW